MKAFHGSSEIQRKYIDRMAEHIRLDQLQPRKTWDDVQHVGCAVGCTFDAYEHERGPIEIGFPVELIHLQDAMFEGLAPDGHQEFALAFLKAPKLGADLTFVWPRFAHWLLSSEESPMYGPAQDTRVKPAIDAVAALYAEWIETGVRPSKGRWEAARTAGSWAEVAARAAAARAEARAAEVAAAASWAAAAARVAARTAWAPEWVARAVWAAAWASAWAPAAARVALGASGASAVARAALGASGAVYRKMADRLLQLMAEAPAAAQ